MKKVIWSCWLQGRSRAPWLVDRCLASWERMNPDWEFRCVDQYNLRHFVDVPDLRNKRVTRISFSDVVRILLLKEYGGIWTDATVFCHRSLDDWLDTRFVNGFFAFDRPTADRMLSSWFLASSEDSYIVDRWCTKVLDYWAERTHADMYFWFHDLFRQLFDSDSAFAAAWNAVPKVSASGPNAIQSVGMFQTSQEAIGLAVDWQCPVFKLTYRVDHRQCVEGTLLARLLGPAPSTEGQGAALEDAAPNSDHNGAVEFRAPPTFAFPRASTNNLEDHIQVLAGLRLLRTLGVVCDFDVQEMASRESSRTTSRAPVLRNAWLGTNGTELPSNDRLTPMSLAVQLRPLPQQELFSGETGACAWGLRDPCEQPPPEVENIDRFVSDYVTLLFPRRREAEINGNSILVVSRDRRLLDILPISLGEYTYVSHYSDSFDFSTNMARAAALLETCRTQARLIITTSLHCALLAIGMGIPVVVFHPDSDSADEPDRAGFRALNGLTTVHSLREVDRVDWHPRPVDTTAQKLAILDHFMAAAGRWPRSIVPIGPFACASELPPPP